MRWTRWRCAREVLQGGLKLCLGAPRVPEPHGFAVRNNAARPARINRSQLIEIQPGSIGRQSGSDGGKRNSSPGRARHKPSNHCAGKAGCSPLDLYARVHFFVPLHTRPRVQRAPGLPCALVISGARAVASTRGARRLRAWRCVWTLSPPLPAKSGGEGDEAAAPVAGHAGLSCTFGS